MSPSNSSAPRRTIWVARAVAIMAAVWLLAGCLSISTDGAVGADGASGGSYSYVSPDAVAGSGRLTSRVIDVSRVTSVETGATFLVHLKTGSPAQATVTMDDNLTDRVEATVSGNELHLGIKPGMSVRNATLRADVTVGWLDRLAASGASHATIDSQLIGSALQLVVEGASQITGPVGVDRLEASGSGASVLTLSRRADSMHLDLAGTSRLLGSKLAVADLDAELSGASQATVAVSNTLAVTANGASILRYRGNPTITRQETSGVASIGADSSK
jgi:Putative auto-transporter adhesin, head GIN domain